MFTGLIQNLGEIVRHDLERDSSKVRGSTLAIRIPQFLRLFELGESIAVNGVCLTAVKAELDIFTAELSPETLNRTALFDLRPGQFVNIEFPITLSTPMGGHFVQGHIDGVGSIAEIEKLEKYHRVSFYYPRSLAAFLIEKGSIAVDGVSLTINQLQDSAQGMNTFEVMIIPHTWQSTIFKNYKVNDRVNLEVDMLAKYVARSLQLKTKESKNENFDYSRAH